MNSMVALSGGCCCLMLVVLIAGVVYFLFGRKQNQTIVNMGVPGYAPTNVVPGAPVGGGWGNLVSRVTSDGFWMLGESLQPGSLVNYRYRSGNDWVSRSVPYQPGPDGHFVYLGHPPGNIQVTHVTPPNANAAMPVPPPPEPEQLPTMIISTPFAKPTGYPPAY